MPVQFSGLTAKSGVVVAGAPGPVRSCGRKPNGMLLCQDLLAHEPLPLSREGR